MKKEYKISIITVCYNSAKTIKDTFESVLNQKYENYEYIVVDGKSNDGTLELIKEYEEKFNGKMKYISEKDKGIYDAMNKGIKLSTGDIVGLLNSDDYYKNNEVLSKINESLQQDYDGVFGNLIMLEDKQLNIPERELISGNGNYHFGWVPLHPTLYLKKQIYNEIGLYNQKYPIAADYDFMIRLLKQEKYKLNYINDYLVSMRSGGASTNGLKGRIDGVKEVYIILRENKVKFALFTTLSKLLISILKALKAKF